MKKLLAFVFVFVNFSYLSSQTVCGGSTATLTATNPQGLTGPSYSLNPGGFSPINGNQFVVSPPSTTTYTIYTTGTNTANALVTTSVVTTLTVLPQPNTTPTFTQATCTNSLNTVNLGLFFNPPTPAPGYTINWNPLPGTVLSPQQTTATALSPGPHIVNITTTGGCATTLTFDILPQPAPAVFSVIPFGGSYSITCRQSTVELSATNANLTYTWSGVNFASVFSPSITLDNQNLGTFTLTGRDPVSNCSQTHTLLLSQDIAIPSSTLSTTNIHVTCSQSVAPTLSVTSSPTVNITHNIYSPLGGTFTAASYTAIYHVSPPGTYTHVLVNEINGCSTTKTFVVTSDDDYPVFEVTSANSFTLGCGTKSVGTISIDDAETTPTPGGPVSYTIIGPPTTTAIASGDLSSVSLYTVTVPGTWTVIVKDNTNGCISSIPVSVLQKTLAPNVSAILPLQILDCNTPSMVMEGFTETPNVNYVWTFPQVPGTIISNTIAVNVNSVGASVTSSIINIYTLTITDNVNTCSDFSVIPVYQNLYPPVISIAGSSNGSVTCLTNSITLTNQSTSSIPPETGFPRNKPVQGYLWEGPSPQEPLQVSTSYVGGVPGVYTLTGKDLNNGCTNTGTLQIYDNRISPIVVPKLTPDTIDCGTNATATLSPLYQGNTQVYTYSWTVPPGAGPSETVTPAILRVSTPGIYTIAVTNTVNGCRTQSVVSAVTGSLRATFVANPEKGFAPLTVNFTNNSFSSSGTSSITAMWGFGNGTTSGSTTPTGSFVPGAVSSTVVQTSVYNQPGTYTIVMYAAKGECLDTAYHVINVDIPSSLEVPNVFTPNGDGVNDLFFLKANNLTEINMVIFDRWGNIAYELISPTGNIEWDGKNGQGNDAAEGTYFYLLKATGSDGQTYDQKGTINLYR